MKSQVSFVYDGNHNTAMIKHILKENLNGVKTYIETLDLCTNRIYIAANETAGKVLHICHGMQSNSVLDDSRDID